MEPPPFSFAAAFDLATSATTSIAFAFLAPVTFAAFTALADFANFTVSPPPLP